MWGWSVVAFVAFVALAAWLYLAVGHGGFWLAEQGPPPAPGPATWPEVVAVIPARDESAVLPRTLPSLLAQRYPGRFRVVLVDDGSRDGTAAVAERLGREAGSAGSAELRAVAAAEPPAGSAGSAELRVVGAAEPPAGWAGKVWAMAEGVRAAGDPGYLLFTDADIAYEPGALARLVAAAVHEDRDLVSLMATLRTETRWERVIVPAFVYFFAQLYPFRRVRQATARTAAAAGGCMLVRRRTLAGAGGLAAIRGARIDDVALGRLVKRHGGRCRLDLSRDVVSRRPYPRLADLWNMVTRSAYTQLRHSPLLLAGTLLGLLVLYAVPPAAVLAGGAGLGLGVGLPAMLTMGAGLLAWAIMAMTYVPTLRFYRSTALRAPLLPLVAMLYAAMTLASARLYHTGRGGAWKGRTIGGSALPAAPPGPAGSGPAGRP